MTQPHVCLLAVSRVTLLDGDLVDAVLVATAFKGCGHEGLDHGDGLLIGDKAARHGDDIGIVVLTGQAGHR